MIGTEEAMEILGKSGTIVEFKEDLPDGYEIELSWLYSEILGMIEDSDSLDELEAKLREEQDRLQGKLSRYRNRVNKQLDKIDQGDKVLVHPNIGDDFKGKVVDYRIDCGEVFYKIRRGKSKGVYKSERLTANE